MSVSIFKDSMLKLNFLDFDFGISISKNDLLCLITINDEMTTTIRLGSQRSCFLTLKNHNSLLKCALKTIEEDELIGSVTLDLGQLEKMLAFERKGFIEKWYKTYNINLF